MPLSRSASRTGRKLSPGTQNACLTPLMTSCSTSAAAAVRLVVGLCIDDLSGLLRPGFVDGEGSGPVQHEFGIGEVGEPGRMRALEILAAARAGIDAGQAR